MDTLDMKQVVEAIKNDEKRMAKINKECGINRRHKIREIVVAQCAAMKLKPTADQVVHMVVMVLKGL